MPRRRYPSDDQHNAERRKSKPHVRIEHSVTNHRLAGQVWRDGELRSAFIGLYLLASEKGAAHTEDVIYLGVTDIMETAAKARLDRAWALLERLCEVMRWTYQIGPTLARRCANVRPTLRERSGNVPGTLRERPADVAAIHIRNFAKKQGLGTRGTRNEGRTPDSPPHPTPHSAHHEEDNSASLRSAAPAVRSPDGQLWEAAVQLLAETDSMSRSAAKKFLGCLAKGGRKAELLRCIGSAIAERPASARAYLAGAMQHGEANGRRTQSRPGAAGSETPGARTTREEWAREAAEAQGRG